MSNPMDRFSSQCVNPNSPVNVVNINNNQDIVQQFRMAMSNPKQFTDYFAKNNPQAYQYAMQLANNSNPRQLVLQMLKARGLNPGMFNLPGYM